MSRSLLAVLLLISSAASADCVVLLHGLARSASSMEPMAQTFRERGYRVVNVDYPSRHHAIEVLAPLAVEQGMAGCSDASRLHFVTHSLGGILLRYYLAEHSIPGLGRVVMLAPPNQGSEVVDRLRGMPGYAFINGPAGQQLGTGSDSVPRRLGPVSFELGVIAGDKTINFLLSQTLPNPDDGKVSVASTKVEGMRDFLQVPHSHPFIMRAPRVRAQAVAFIENGKFDRSEPVAKN